ncbi:MAG: ribonuclease E inhibitor RraB [Steroidobacteraceae bacterium]
MYLLLILAAAVALARIVFAIRRTRSQPRNDWDTQMVRNLRAHGANAFTPYEVDFFFSVPDEAGCRALRGTLEPEGFAIDVRDMRSGGTGFSLHATKRLQISVSAMQEISQRFNTLAEQLGGDYDGWTTDPSRT